jgi:FkbM family methyltransferase
VLGILLGIIRHPLNRQRPFAALRRFVSWQLGTRLLPGSVAVPFVGTTRLLIRRGMSGATGNVYCGLHEFEDMAFVLHALRPGDLFVDVGANIGSYTILAAGVTRSTCVSIEPVPGTFASLLDNLRLNDLSSVVEPRNIALGRESGTLKFTSDLDTVNHAVGESEEARSAIVVQVMPLDALLGDRVPAVIKIDVEGFESSVVDGAESTFNSPGLFAVLMELNGSGQRYGFSDDALHDRMLAFGFSAARYEPKERRLVPLTSRGSLPGNILYVKRWPELQARLTEAPVREVLGTRL